MMKHKITPSVDYKYWLDTQLNESTKQNSMKIIKAVKQTNKETLTQNFGD